MIPPVPFHLTRRITERGGRADNGLPLFRAMRTCDVFQIVGGEWRHFDAHGNYTGSHIGEDKVTRYPDAKDRYVFEMWMAQEFTFSEWNERFTRVIDGQIIRELGPYPENGTYEPFQIIEKIHVDEKTKKILYKEFAPLTATLCDALVDLAVVNKHLPAEHKMKAAKERREREEKAKDQRQIDIINDLAGPNWQRQPHIFAPGLKAEQISPGGIILP